MVVSERVDRWVLLLAYTLATVLSQCAHDHGARPSPSTAHAEAGRDGLGPVIADHDEATAPTHHDGCVACRFLSETPAHQFDLPSFCRVVAEAARLAPSPTPRAGSVIRPSCRAPPLG